MKTEPDYRCCTSLLEEKLDEFAEIAGGIDATLNELSRRIKAGKLRPTEVYDSITGCIRRLIELYSDLRMFSPELAVDLSDEFNDAREVLSGWAHNLLCGGADADDLVNELSWCMIEVCGRLKRMAEEY